MPQRAAVVRRLSSTARLRERLLGRTLLHPAPCTRPLGVWGTARVPPCHRIPVATPGVRAARDGVNRDDVQGRRLDHDGTTAWSKCPRSQPPMRSPNPEAHPLAHSYPLGPGREPPPRGCLGKAAAVPWSVATSAADVASFGHFRRSLTGLGRRRDGRACSRATALTASRSHRAGVPHMPRHHMPRSVCVCVS